MRSSVVVNFLLVVFLNAFSDLGHKINIQNTIFKTYDGSEQIVLTAVVNALMLLPFILAFSPSAFLSSRFDKARILQVSSFVAIIITLLITLSYYNGWFWLAFAFTFAMALQSAFYSPAKYAYLKELLGESKLSVANGALQAVTTVAILAGIIVYTLFFESMVGDEFRRSEEIIERIAPLGWLLVAGSVLEFLLSLRLTRLRSYEGRRFSFRRYIKLFYLRKNLKTITRKRDLLSLVFALSIFWSISQVILAIFGEYVKTNLGITNAIFVQGVMASSIIGIVAGSLIVARLSRYYINVGFASIGAVMVASLTLLLSMTQNSYLLALEFVLFGFFSGFIIVPLNAKMQFIAPNIHLGSILAGNNFIQTLFMFASLMLTTLFAYFGADAKVLFYAMSLAGVLLFVTLLRTHGVISAWAFLELVARLRYRFVYEGLDLLDGKTPLLLAGNHISWIDWLALQLPFERRVAFLVDKEIYDKPLLKPFLRTAGLIPISARASKDAFKRASAHLRNGGMVAIFPEGEIVRSGEAAEFRNGLNYIDLSGVKVVPFYISGLFGSVFARFDDGSRSLRRRVVKVHFGLRGDSSTLRDDVLKLRDDKIAQK